MNIENIKKITLLVDDDLAISANNWKRELYFYNVNQEAAPAQVLDKLYEFLHTLQSVNKTYPIAVQDCVTFEVTGYAKKRGMRPYVNIEGLKKAKIHEYINTLKPIFIAETGGIMLAAMGLIHFLESLLIRFYEAGDAC